MSFELQSEKNRMVSNWEWRGLIVACIFLNCLAGLWDLRAQEPSPSPWRVAPEPEWVTRSEVTAPGNFPSGDLRGGMFTVLKDYQTKVGPQENYYHMARLLLDANGVQNGSRIQISFDPLYESVTFHRVSILRDGKLLDRLAETEVREMVREPGLDNNLLSGRVTLVMDVGDTRVGDLLEYSLTVHGENPNYQGQFFSSWIVGGEDPIARQSVRVVAEPGRNLVFRSYGKEAKPEIRDTASGLREWVWTWNDLPPIVFEGLTPVWTKEWPWVQVAESRSWADVVEWALPYYELDQTISPEPEMALKEWSQLNSEEEKVLAALKWIQREVRYLAQMMGVHSHAPRTALEVSTKKYGDCKEKTVLLGVMLRKLGIECYPVLVSTTNGPGIADMLPSPDVFDHVILGVEIGTGEKRRTIYMDATRNEHHGEISEIGLLPFGLGLPLRKSQSELVPVMPQEGAKRFTKIREILELDSKGGASLKVTTTLRASSAESTRQDISERGLREVGKAYLDYYAKYFPGISAAENLQISESKVKNELTITESYRIPEVYQKSESGEGIFELPRGELLSFLTSPSATERKFPLAIPHPVEFIQHTTVLSPGGVNVPPHASHVENDIFDFRVDSAASGERFDITRRYSSKRDHAKPEEYAKWLVDVRQAREDSGYSLTDNSHLRKGGHFMLIACLAGGIMGALGIMVAGWLVSLSVSRRPLPPHLSYLTIEGIGGWLVLPAIGLPLGFLSTAFGALFAVKNFANFTDVGMIAEFGVWHSVALLGLLCANFWNSGLLLLTCILFFRRSRMIPALVTCVFVAVIFLAIADFVLAKTLESKSFSEVETAMAELIFSAIKAAIWIPYFHVSKRVQATFLR